MSGKPLGGQASGPSFDPAAVLAGSAVFSNYGRAAIVAYVASDIALVGAALAYFFLDLATAIAIGTVAIILTLIALRCGQVVFSRRTAEDKIDAQETVLAELGARRAVRASLLRSPVLLILSDRQLYLFEVSIFGSGEPHRHTYDELQRLSPDMTAGTLAFATRSSNDGVSLTAVKPAELARVTEVLNERRPGIFAAHVH